MRADDVLCNGTGINTAIGCLSVLDNQNAFLADILKWAVGIGGGIAFLLIVYAGFMIMTAGGNSEKVKKGRDVVLYAVIGFAVILFAQAVVFILKDLLGE